MKHAQGIRVDGTANVAIPKNFRVFAGPSDSRCTRKLAHGTFLNGLFPSIWQSSTFALTIAHFGHPFAFRLNVSSFSCRVCLDGGRLPSHGLESEGSPISCTRCDLV